MGAPVCNSPAENGGPVWLYVTQTVGGLCFMSRGECGLRLADPHPGDL